MGDYSFDAQLREGFFNDTATTEIYTTCKNNTFNGMSLPSIWVVRENGIIENIRTFGYHDFKMRLGR